jgi:ABC-type nitrate/sulfonate/bicarbonate transport system substrate-binding protein
MQLKPMSNIGKWALLLVLAGIGRAQWVGGAEPIRPVLLQVPSIDTGTTLLLLYGKRWDLFKQEGLDLRIVVARPNVATATLISGDAQFSAQFQSCYYSGIRGVPVKSFMVINSRAPFHFVARPEIKSFQDLKGKSIGVASLATATHYAAKRAISHFGLNPDRDVTYLALGALQTRLSALENNAIQASILSAPWHLLAKQFGGKELLFVGDVLEMPSGGLCSTEKLLREEPQLIKRMIRATLRTFRKVRESRGDAIYHRHLDLTAGYLRNHCRAVAAEKSDRPAVSALLAQGDARLAVAPLRLIYQLGGDLKHQARPYRISANRTIFRVGRIRQTNLLVRLQSCAFLFAKATGAFSNS